MSLERIGFAFNPTNPAALELRDRAESWCRMRQLAAWAAPSSDIDADPRSCRKFMFRRRLAGSA